MEIEISKIVIPEDRQRKKFDPDKLQELANSIKENGLIHPIVVDENNNLVSGQRRLMAHIILERQTIRYERFEGLDEWQKKTIELEENIRRENLTWQEEINAKSEIHKLYQEKFGASIPRKKGGWGIDDTADLLGESHGSMSQDLKLAEAIKTDPELIKKDSKVAAFKALQVKTQLAMKQEIAQVFADLDVKQGISSIQVRLGDSRELLKEYDEETFDFCVTDPQYGIGVHDMQDTFPNRGDVRQGIEFDDSRPVLVDVVEPIMKEVYRVLRPGSHCYVFFAIARYTEVRALLERSGFWVCPTPLFWIKNNALNLRPWITYPVNYEPIFYCAKGYPPRPLTTIQPLSTIEHPILGGTGKVHPTEKPVPVVKWLIGNCSSPKEKGLDPFLGGGTFTVACKEMDRLAVGIEIDKVWWMEAKKKVEEE